MTKHTPGPWKVNPNAGEVRGADWNIIVADVPHDADARLIAAAPDLLAACEMMLTVYGLAQEAPHAVDVMRAAVAKAKGE